MEDKLTGYVCNCEKMEGFSDYFIESVKKSIESGIDSFTGEEITPGSEKYLEYLAFVKQYNHDYKKLKENVGHLVLDVGSATTDFSCQDKWNEELEKIDQAISRIKCEVLAPVFEQLGPQVIEASRSTESLLGLMRMKQVDHDNFHQIVSGLVRWHVLDDLQIVCKTRDFCRCSFVCPSTHRHSGRPKENFYELADKERLRDTLDVLYQEKFNMSLTQGWMKSQLHTRNFLMAYILSLYSNPYGMLSAYHSFLKDVCGYAFLPVVRTFQNWFSNYQKIVRERSRSQMGLLEDDQQKACSKVRKYASIDSLVEWIRIRLPQHGISMA